MIFILYGKKINQSPPWKANDQSLLDKLHNIYYIYNLYIYFQVMLMFKAGGSWGKFFVTRRDLFISGLFGGIFVSFYYRMYLFIGSVLCFHFPPPYNWNIVESGVKHHNPILLLFSFHKGLETFSFYSIYQIKIKIMSFYDLRCTDIILILVMVDNK